MQGPVPTPEEVKAEMTMREQMAKKLHAKNISEERKKKKKSPKLGRP